jgi:alpha-acetolactate decarboxylase
MKRLLSLKPLLCLMGCTSIEGDMIFHYSILKALDNRVLEGNMKVGELKQHGDFGLATFNKLNGKKIVLPDTENFREAHLRSEAVNY